MTDFTVERQVAEYGKYEYNFYLFIETEDQPIMSANTLERNGIEFEDVPNWTVALEKFGEFYVDCEDTTEAIRRTRDFYSQ